MIARMPYSVAPETAIVTASGIYFDLLTPNPRDVTICDIAAALGKLCRYTGHTDTFYSVAQHSVITSHLVPAEHALQALLHDAAEAYVGDVSSPLKALLAERYRAIERRVQCAIFATFGVPLDMHEEVHIADRFLLAWERRDLLCEQRTVWRPIASVLVPDTVPQIEPLDCDAATESFLDRFHELIEAREAHAASAH